MPCGGSNQVFAFTTLSPTSQLSLASCMTTTSLIDFAAASPTFNIFLHTRTTEIVLSALRTQYGYTPDTATWDCHLLPLYTNLSPHDTPRTLPHSPARRRHKRTSNSTHDLPLLQHLADEEHLSDHAIKLLSLLPSSPQAPAIFGPGIRGLQRYCQRYTELKHSPDTDHPESMQQWLKERYTPWGINEIVFVVDALSNTIDTLIPSLHTDPMKRSQLLGSLLCGMEVLRLGVEVPTSEDAVLRKLADRGVIVFTSGKEWDVADGSNAHWFSVPPAPTEAEVEVEVDDEEEEEEESGEERERCEYVLAGGAAWREGVEKVRFSNDRSGMKLMAAGAAAGAEGTETVGVRRAGRADRGGFLNWGVRWGLGDWGCMREDVTEAYGFSSEGCLQLKLRMKWCTAATP